MIDYSTAAPQQDFGTIPDGTLAWAVLTLRPFKEGQAATPSGATEGNAYLDFELTICQGQFVNRKVWEMVGVAGSEKYVNQGRSAIRSILEVGRGASAQNMAGYQIPEYFALHGLKVAIELGVEKGGGTYPDKNRVKSWLTPNTESSTHKKFARLLAGETGAAAAAATSASAAATNAWAQPPATTAAPPATSTPSWLVKV